MAMLMIHVEAPSLVAKEVVATVDRNDDVNRLWEKVRLGKLNFKGKRSAQEVLQMLLEELKIPVSSQVLVYSKTSLQVSGINPAKPRAIYFNAHTYLGWVQGGDIEVIAIDPEAGPQYYLIEVAGWEKEAKKETPTLWRSYDCQSCHLDPSSAIQVLSVNTDRFGYATTRDLNLLTTYQSPIEERWGGWYVTGGISKVHHLGNWQSITATEGEKVPDSPVAEPNHLQESDLKKFFDVTPYLWKGSDILALMVLEHQSVVQNEISGSGLAMRRVLHRAKNDLTHPTVVRAVRLHSKKILELILQLGDHSFDGVIEPGSSQYAESFLQSANKDSKGRSLRDFAYAERLFKYRCSYMIYSSLFQALPEVLKTEIYRRLHQVLRENQVENFDHLGDEERAVIAEILEDTLPELKATWSKMKK